MGKLDVNKTRVATALLLFPREKGKKYEQNPKVRSFQIKTNKILEIKGKEVGYTEGRC
jgi:hypothetical protein